MKIWDKRFGEKPVARSSEIPPGNQSAAKTRATGGLPGKMRFNNAVGKIRNTPIYGLPFNVFTRQPADPSKPDVRGLAKEPVLPMQQEPLSAKRDSGLRERLNASIESLFPPNKPKMAPAPNAITSARASECATLDAVASLFDATAFDPARANALGRGLLASFDRLGAKPAETRGNCLLMAQALHSVLPNDPEKAAVIWSHILGESTGETLDPEGQRQANDVMRAIASVDIAFDALTKLRTRDDPPPQTPAEREQRKKIHEAEKFAWQITDQLIRTGTQLHADSPRGINDFVTYAAIRVGLEENPKRRRADRPPPLLGSTEGSDILACQALLYANAAMQPATAEAPTAQQSAAYMAWRNGFHESGPGTDFNQAVHRLHKFTIWVDRAQHRSAFFSRNMPQAAGEWMASVMGKNLSPLDATKFGLAGADHGLMSVSKNNFETTLEGAMEKVHMALLAQIDELRDAPEAPEVDQKQLAECCLRCAVIEQWRDGIGLRKNVSLNADQRAAAMREAQQLGADPKALKSSSAARQTLRLKTLEKWGYEALLGTGQSPGALRDDIATARNIARGAVAKPEGNPTSAGLRDLAAQALDTIGVTWRHQGTRGADMSVSFGLQTGSSEVTAGVGPQHRRVRGRQAAVRVGTTSAGSEIFFGTEKRKARQTGIVGRLGFGLGEVGHGAASLGMNANVLPWGTESAEEAGVSIRFPKGSPNQREQAKGVIDFLFDAADARSEGRPASGPQLWEEFAQKFVSNESISVNYQTNNSVTKRQVAGMAAAARVGIGDVAVGPGFGIAAESSKSHAERKDLHGRVPVHLVNQGTRQAVQGSVSVSGTIPRIHPSGTGLLRTVIPTNAPLGTIRTDFTLGGEQGQVRVAFNNGRVDPKLTLAYYEHRNQGDYLKHIEAKRSVWERALREEPIVDPDRPEREKPGVSGKDAVDAYIKDVLGLNIKDQTGGNRGYLDRYSLTADAAEELDLIFGQKVLLEREPSSQTVEREIRSLDAQVHKVLKATTSWMPERMAVFEIEPHTEAKGFDFILSAQSRLQAIPTLRYLVERRLPGTSSTPKAQKTRIEVPPEITEPEAPAKRGFFDRKRGEPQRKLTKTPPPKISMSNAEFLKANGYLVEPFRMPEPKTR